MSDLQTFGPLISGPQVSNAVKSTLETWMPTYCRAAERLLALPWSLPVPNSYTITADSEHWPEEQLPAVMVISSGTTKRPMKDGRQTYRAFWTVGVRVVAASQDRDTSKALAEYYGATVRMLMVNKAALGGFATNTTWTGERYDFRLIDRSQRTLGAAHVFFEVDVRNVVRALGGPLAVPTDPADPPSDLPVVGPVSIPIPITFNP